MKQFSTIIAAVVGVVALQACKAPSKGNGESTAAAEKEGATFVPTLTKLVADPKNIPPKTTKPGAETVYTYDDPKGTPLHGLQMIVKKPGVWMIQFSAVPPISPSDFAPGETEVIKGDDDESTKTTHWYLRKGPLAGQIVAHSEALHWRLMSVAYAMSTLDGGERMNRDLCDANRVPNVKAMERSDFKLACEDQVKKKLLVPSGADFDDGLSGSKVLTDPECKRTWTSSVEAPNALGVKIKHSFRCTHTPKTGAVDVTM